MLMMFTKKLDLFNIFKIGCHYEFIQKSINNARFQKIPNRIIYFFGYNHYLFVAAPLKGFSDFMFFVGPIVGIPWFS